MTGRGAGPRLLRASCGARRLPFPELRARCPGVLASVSLVLPDARGPSTLPLLPFSLDIIHISVDSNLL